jgi:hypothetical protein
LHALLTLNDTTYVEAARVLAQVVLRHTPDDAARLDRVYRRVVGRSPDSEETAVLMRGLHRHRLHYTAQPAAAAELLSVGEQMVDPELDPVEHAAWTVLCSTVLNLDEALTKE